MCSWLVIYWLFVSEYVTCRDLAVGWIFQTGVRDFSVVQNVQNGSRPYPSSYSVGAEGSWRIWGVRLSADLHLSLTLRTKIIAARKMKTMAFKGTDPVRSEIVMNDNIMVQINTCVASFHTRTATILLLKYKNFSR